MAVVVQFEDNQYTKKLNLLAVLLDAQTATTSGIWLPFYGIRPITFDFQGISGDTILLCFSSSPIKPADSTHGGLYRTITADEAFTVDSALRWVKCRKTAGSSAVNGYAYAG